MDENFQAFRFLVFIQPNRKYIPCLLNEKTLGVSLEKEVRDIRKISKIGSNWSIFCIVFPWVSPKWDLIGERSCKKSQKSEKILQLTTLLSTLLRSSILLLSAETWRHPMKKHVQNVLRRHLTMREASAYLQFQLQGTKEIL